MFLEIKEFIIACVVLFPAVAHFAFLIGFGVWSIIDDSNNLYMKFIWVKLDRISDRDEMSPSDKALFFVETIGCAAFYTAMVPIMIDAPIIPISIMLIISIIMLARFLRRVQKVVNDHVNNKKIHN